MENNRDDLLPALTALKEHAAKRGLDAEMISNIIDDEPRREYNYLYIDMANGRDTYKLRVNSSETASDLLEVDLDKIVYLGDYLAYHDRDSGIIEAIVLNARGFSARMAINRIHGAIYEESIDKYEEQEQEEDLIQLVESEKTITLGPVTRKGNLLLRERYQASSSAYSIRLTGFNIQTHDQAKRILENTAGSLFFEFDIMYDQLLSLRRRTKRLARLIRRPSRKEPRFPKNRYSKEALTLYEYGRSARGLPLLEFLAYYQAIEYFFPVFAHADASNAMRTELLNPRFDPSSDADLSRLIKLAAPAIKAGVGEKEQLRATLHSATTLDGIRDAIERLNTSSGNILTDKRGELKGVLPLKVDSDNLRDQLADRIYTIRCRIVHAKQDGGHRNDELLLPTGIEKDHLWADVEILRYIAQQAIFSQPLRD